MSNTCFEQFSIAELSSKVKILVDTLDLDQLACMKMLCGYTLVSYERLYQKLFGDLELNLGRRFYLKKDGTVVLTFDKDELGMADAVYPTTEYRRNLFTYVSSYLEEHEGKEKTELIQKNFFTEATPKQFVEEQKISETGNIAEAPSDDTLDIVRFPYPEELQVKIPLGDRYTLESVEAECVYSLNLGDFIKSWRIFVLKFGNEVLREIRIPEGNPDRLPALNRRLRSKLLSGIMAVLIEREGKDPARKIGTLLLFKSEGMDKLFGVRISMPVILGYCCFYGVIAS